MSKKYGIVTIKEQTATSSDFKQDGIDKSHDSIIVSLDTDPECNPSTIIHGAPVLPSRRVTLKKWVDRTTAHGVQDCYHSGSWLGRIIWSVLLLTMLAFLTFGVVMSIKQFFENPVITSTSIQIEIPKRFPDIYICPSQSINIDAYMKANDTTKSTIQHIFADEHQLLHFLLPNHSQSQEDNPAFKETFDLITFMNLISTIAYKPDELFPWISFARKTIKGSLLSLLVIDKVGLCYHIPIKSGQALPDKGLKLLMRQTAVTNHRLNITFPYNFFDGATIGVAPTGHEAVAFGNSWMVQSGTSSKLRLTQTNKALISVSPIFKHSRTCHNNSNTTDFKFLDSNIYTRTTCLTDCTSYMCFDLINCVTPLTPSVVKEQFRTGYRTCRYDDIYSFSEEYLQNRPDVRKRLEKCFIGCDYSCRQMEYQATVTSKGFHIPMVVHEMSPTPDQPVKDLLDEVLGSEGGNHSVSTMIDIAFGSLETTQITESPSITPSNFLSDIGGHFGLWIGASLMTIAQLIVFCCAGLLQAWRDFRHRMELKRAAAKWKNKCLV